MMTASDAIHIPYSHQSPVRTKKGIAQHHRLSPSFDILPASLFPFFPIWEYTCGAAAPLPLCPFTG